MIMRLYLLFLYNQNLFIPSSTGSLHFFFSMKRKPALKEKSEGGASPHSPLGRAGTPSRRPPRGRFSLPPPPPVRGTSRENHTLPSRDLFEYETVSCNAMFLPSQRACYRRVFEAKIVREQKAFPRSRVIDYFIIAGSERRAIVPLHFA